MASLFLVDWIIVCGGRGSGNGVFLWQAVAEDGVGLQMEQGLVELVKIVGGAFIIISCFWCNMQGMADDTLRLAVASSDKTHPF